jgi:hypothetical protein
MPAVQSENWRLALAFRLSHVVRLHRLPLNPGLTGRQG